MFAKPEKLSHLIAEMKGRTLTVYWATESGPGIATGELVDWDESWLHLTCTVPGQQQQGHWIIRIDSVEAISEGVPKQDC